MKKRSLGLLTAVILFVASAGSMGGCSKKDWQNVGEMALAGAAAYVAVASDDMNLKRDLMITYVLQANVKFLVSIATLQDAVGHKDKAEALRMKANDISSNPQNYQSEAGLKEVFEVSNNAAQEVSTIDAKGVQASEEANQKMNEAYIDLGVAASWDGGAITMATFLGIQAGKGMQKNDKNYQNYVAIASIANMVAMSLPVQIDLIGDVKGQIEAYYAANELPVPTDEEIEQRIEKEKPVEVKEDEFSRLFVREPAKV